MLRKGSLIVGTSFWERDRHLEGNLNDDRAKHALCRLAFALHHELREGGVSSVAVSPGWTRTVWVLAGHQADESNRTQKPDLAAGAKLTVFNDPVR